MRRRKRSDCGESQLSSHRSVPDLRRMTLTMLHARPFLVKLREGVARLLMPYLKTAGAF